MGKVVCFGELLVRFSAEGYLRFPQANMFSATYTGAEGNVALALSNFGLESSFVTKLPKNEIAQNAIRQLKAYDVDVSDIIFGGDRIGIYYIEKGASQRPSKIIYDRKHSSFADSSITDYDWDKIFSDAEWFHFTGITAGLSDSCAELCAIACKKAKEHGVTVSCDLNYRKALWTREKAREVMIPLMENIDVLFANEEDCFDSLGISVENSNIEQGTLNYDGYKGLASILTQRFNLKYVSITLRESLSASDNNWSGLLFDGRNAYISKKYKIHLVDRVGGGDSFASGMIYALIQGYEPQQAVEFAAAASCLKQTIEFDYNLSTVEEILNLANGNGSGRVQR